jgi:hypothetical protein
MATFNLTPVSRFPSQHPTSLKPPLFQPVTVRRNFRRLREPNCVSVVLVVRILSPEVQPMYRSLPSSPSSHMHVACLPKASHPPPSVFASHVTTNNYECAWLPGCRVVTCTHLAIMSPDIHRPFCSSLPSWPQAICMWPAFALWSRATHLIWGESLLRAWRCRCQPLPFAVSLPRRTPYFFFRLGFLVLGCD